LRWSGAQALGCQYDGEQKYELNFIFLSIATATINFFFCFLDERELFRNIRLFIGISGAYDLEGLSAHLHSRGLDASILSWICGGDIKHYSPTLQIPLLAEQIKQRLSRDREAASLLDANSTLTGTVHAAQTYQLFSHFPPVLLLHGSLDRSIPPSASVSFAQALVLAGGSATVELYDGWSHTYAVLEGPLSGDHRLVEDMIRDISLSLGEGSNFSKVDSCGEAASLCVHQKCLSVWRNF